MSTIVKDQKSLDAALKAGATDIVIDAPEGVWIRLEGGSSHVVARGSSHVEAWDSSHVEAWDSSHVEARGSSHVEAWDSSHVEAWDSSHVEARDSSHVEARDSSHVEARDSSHVEAWDSSHVEARDSSHVEARGSSHVEAWDSSHVVAAKYVAVHLFSKRVKLTGSGVLIDLTDLDTNKVDDYLAFHGVEVTDGKAIVYKAVDQSLNAGQGYTLTNYPIGGTVTAADWRASQACGNGLHFGHRPAVARGYFNGSGEPRFLACEIDVASMIALGDKCKAPSAKVLHEVDLWGNEVVAEAVAS